MSNIKNVKPNNRNYKQGYYRIIYPDKYIGDISKVIFRSSYEYRFMVYCDKNDKVLKWSSEPIGIKYLNPLDNREHQYYIDFYVKILNKEGIEENVLVEVKPESQITRPIFEQKKIRTKYLKNYNKSMEMYIQNIAKWNSAKSFAEQRNMKFMIITEKFLGL